VSRLITDLYNL